MLMPKKVHTEDWVKAARDTMRAEMAADAKWYISNRRGSVQLEVRDNGQYQSIMLNYEWSKNDLFKAARRIIKIYENFYSDIGRGNLKKSCKVVESISNKGKIDFDEIFKEFRKFCVTASDKTWNKSYVPVLHKCQELLEKSKGKPSGGEELMISCLEQWEEGSRSRQIAKRVIYKFLEWAVLRAKISNIYAPVKLRETLKVKRVGYALEDEQILQLIASENNQSWQFAYQLLSVYGLRPEELRHLVIKKGINGKELWCIYRKSMGGTKGQKTEPRQLAPLLVKDGKGFIDWKLQERIEKGEELPSLGNSAANGLRKHLERNKNWIIFKKQAKIQGESLVPYAFRHRYAKESHASGFPINNIAEAMGHTQEVHLQNYGRFKPSGTTDLYSNRNKQTA